MMVLMPLDDDNKRIPNWVAEIADSPKENPTTREIRNRKQLQPTRQNQPRQNLKLRNEGINI